MNRRAFSLAELLVVIGIVLLLAGLLFPVFQSAREGSRRARCLTQMHQLGQSTLAYLADFGETYPMAAYVQGSMPTCLFTLYHALVPYIKDKQVVTCPTDGCPVNVARVFASYFALCPAMEFTETSYMANWCLFEVGQLPPWLPQPHQVISASILEYPAQTVAFFDAVMTGPPGLTPYVQGRHLEIAVANFADGHSRALHTRRTKVLIPRGDSGSAPLYCLLDVGPYYSGDGICRGRLLGIAGQRQGGQWCWRCPGRPRTSAWHVRGTCETP